MYCVNSVESDTPRCLVVNVDTSCDTPDHTVCNSVPRLFDDSYKTREDEGHFLIVHSFT